MSAIETPIQSHSTVADEPVIAQPVKTNRPAKEWKSWHRVLFRIAFIFFISISIPNSPEWYKIVFNIDWTNLHYRDLYDIARFGSGINFFGNSIFGSTLLGYANWITTAFIAIAGGLLWTAIVRIRHTERKQYDILYYWLRVIVRYRQASALLVLVLQNYCRYKCLILHWDF